MGIFSYSSNGYEGDLIQIEINVFTRSLPGIDIVGLPGSAVKESKVRFRSAILNSGFDFPKGRVIINMAPAGKKKEGASFDLPFACRLLSIKNDKIDDYLVLGELTLNGHVREVSGVLAAITKAYECGIKKFIIPIANLKEAFLLEKGEVYGVSSLSEAMKVISNISKPSILKSENKFKQIHQQDFSDVMGQDNVKHAIEISVAGGHNLLLFGPPGAGKSLSVSRLPSIIPTLTKDEALETSRIWSLAGKLKNDSLIVNEPPIRKPHHSATLESMVGGGKDYTPGEVSLAHNGFLFLDEIAEFRSSILQSLREPLEDRTVSLNRASVSTWYPADFRLIATANPCPCANLGKKDGICMCSDKEIRRYWKKMGGAIMDRIDLRVPVIPVSSEVMLGKKGLDSKTMKIRIEVALNMQKRRFKNFTYKYNSRIAPGDIDLHCSLSKYVKEKFIKGVDKLSLSSRGCHSVLKISRTLADLESSEDIKLSHINEAFNFRRYGDEDYFFN